MKTREEAREVGLRMLEKAIAGGFILGLSKPTWWTQYCDAMNGNRFEEAADIARKAISHETLSKAAVAVAVGCVALPSGNGNAIEVKPIKVEQLKR